MDFEQVLALRQTTRKYTDQKVSDSDLEKILQAAQTAPLAAGDDKTTHLTLVKDPALMEEIRNACMLTSRKTGEKIDALYGVQAIIFVSATDISEDHIEYSNTGCVIENILLQATALGLGSTYIWGCLKKLRKNEEVMKKLCLPQGYEILSAAVVGYPARPLTPRKISRKISVTEL